MSRSQAMVISALLGALLAGCGASPAGTSKATGTVASAAGAASEKATADAVPFPSGAYSGGGSGTPGY